MGFDATTFGGIRPPVSKLLLCTDFGGIRPPVHKLIYYVQTSVGFDLRGMKIFTSPIKVGA